MKDKEAEFRSQGIAGGKAAKMAREEMQPKAKKPKQASKRPRCTQCSSLHYAHMMPSTASFLASREMCTWTASGEMPSLLTCTIYFWQTRGRQRPGGGAEAPFQGVCRWRQVGSVREAHHLKTAEERCQAPRDWQAPIQEQSAAQAQMMQPSKLTASTNVLKRRKQDRLTLIALLRVVVLEVTLQPLRPCQ